MTDTTVEWKGGDISLKEDLAITQEQSNKQKFRNFM